MLQLDRKESSAGGVTAWPVQTRDQSHVDWITAYRKDDWSACRGSFGRQRRRYRSREKHRHWPGNQVSGHLWQLIVLTGLNLAILHGNVLSLYKTNVFQSLTESLLKSLVGLGGPAAQEPDQWQSFLLRVRRKRPGATALQ